MKKRTRCTYEPVEVVKGRAGGSVVVTCRLCGPSIVKRPLALARALEDPSFGRFECGADRTERLRLAKELREVVAAAIGASK